MSEAQRFQFDSVFRIDDGELREAPVVKRRYSADEVDAVRTEAFAEGQGSVEAQAAERMATAVEALAQNAETIVGRLSADRQALLEDAAALALTAARSMSRSVNAGYRREEIAEVVRETVAALPDEPRLEVRAPVDIAEALGPELEFARDRIFVSPDANLAGVDCRIVWGSGEVRRDQASVERHVEALVERHLRAEAAADQQFNLFDDTPSSEEQTS
ncbi:MAG: hypothetical protein AAGL49_10965 [Pseudomonadota bacterium]